MENPENLSPEELAQRKEEMLKFYTESMPYLEAQLNYETKLSEIDEMRLKRTQIQMAYAQMMNPQEEEPMPEAPDAKPKAKKRTLKKQDA
tara:strand:- start:220 stop:489 length:270 start_codon:yes stop_codon:yes gene_type:complete